MDIGILIILDSLQFFKFLCIPKIYCSINSYRYNLVLLIVQEHVKDFCVNMSLYATYYS